MALDPLIAALTQSANQSRQQQGAQWSTPGFIFGEGTNTPDLQSLQRRRAMADQLINASLSRAPQTFGEGLTAIGQALAGRMQDKRIREEEESARAGASEAFSNTVGGASIGAPVPRSAGGMAAPSGNMFGGPEIAPNGGMVVDDASRAPMGGKVTPIEGDFLPSGLYVSRGTRATYSPDPNHLNISMDFNASPQGGARGTEVIIPDSAPPEVHAAAERFNIGVAEFAQRHGIEGYPVRGVRTRSQNGRGVQNTVHVEPFFNDDLAMQEAIKANPEEFARIYDEAFGALPGARLIAPHGVGRDRGAASDVFGDETSYGELIAASLLGGAQPQQPQAPQQAGGMNSATIVQLAQLAANPYLAPEKKAIVESLINQQMQGMDPMRQMQMEKAQLELEAMRNPQAQGYQQVFGRDLGLEGDAANTMFNIGPDGKISQIGGSGVNVSVNNRGNIPAGFQVITDPETGAERMEPIPGSPAAMEAQAEERGAVGRQAQRERAGGTVIQDLQRALDLIPELGPIASGEGVLGGIARQGIGPIPGSASIPGSVANRITQFTESALSNVGLDTLQQMRENSPTGGALGQVPIQQQQRLEQVLGSLNINQPPSELEANIKRVMNIYTDIIYGSAQEREMAVREGRMSPQENAEIEQMYQELPFDERGRRREQQGQSNPAELKELLMQDTSEFTLEELREYNRRLEELLQ